MSGDDLDDFELPYYGLDSLEVDLDAFDLAADADEEEDAFKIGRTRYIKPRKTRGIKKAKFQNAAKFVKEIAPAIENQEDLPILLGGDFVFGVICPKIITVGSIINVPHVLTALIPYLRGKFPGCQRVFFQILLYPGVFDKVNPCVFAENQIFNINQPVIPDNIRQHVNIGHWIGVGAIAPGNRNRGKMANGGFQTKFKSLISVLIG